MLDTVENGLKVIDGGKHIARVSIHNKGSRVVFYGPSKQNVEGKIDPGYTRSIPENYVFWCRVGLANVEIKEI